jgi:voltage-gated potassium channel
VVRTPSVRSGHPLSLRHALAAGASLSALAIAGSAAYATLGERPLDALYRTVAVVTTTGLASPPRSTSEKIVTIVLQILGIAIFLYVVGIVLELAVGGVVTGLLEERRMDRVIEGLRGHHIICGYGRVGTRVARELVAAGRQVVIVDQNAEAAGRARDDGLTCLEGDASHEEVLERAGIGRAASLVTCADNDAANTFVALTAKGLQPELRVVGRASDERAAAKLRRAGADDVVSPYASAADQMAARLLRPQVTAYLTVAASQHEPDFSIEEITVPAGCPAAGKTISDLRVRERTGALIVAVRTREGELDGRPGPDLVLREGDVVIGVGTVEAIRALEDLLGPA